ncbi:hypothetical protein ACLMJK_009557 [Lecanora helva]
MSSLSKAGEGVARPSSNRRSLEKIILEVSKECNVHSSQIEDLYPCTPLQHGLMTLSAVSKASNAVYVAQFVFALKGDVAIERMKNAWEKVSQANAILRTRIVHRDAGALQVVLKAALLDWGDCTDLSRYLQDEGQRSMQYGESLSRFAISQNHIVWTVHHSVYDGFSVGLILKEVAAIYDGETPSIHPPFKNFIKYTQHVNPAQCRSFWTSRLSQKGVPPFPPIRQPNRSPNPKASIQYQAECMVNTSSQVTSATIIQAAWALVLSSQLSSETVSFGLTVNGRNAPVAGIESMIGPTLATVPACLQIDLGQNLAHCLQTVQKHFSDMIPYQNIGLQKIKEINAEACNFNNLLAVQPAEQDATSTPFSHLFTDETEAQEGFFNYALIVQCSLSSGGVLKAHAAFDEDLVDKLQIHRILQQLGHVVRQLGSNDAQRTLREINLVGPEDLEHIQRWNSTPRIPPGVPMTEIQRQFNSQATSTAICSWDGQISYSELDLLSSKLAEYLVHKLKVGPETIVPLCFDRSKWMIIAITAVMRTGGAFTLLDPTYPIDRLKHIVDITKFGTVLVSRSTTSMFAHHLLVDDSLFEGKASIDSNTSCSTQQSTEDAMYVVFTSGSTGEPKGVVITHGSYYAGAMAHIPIYGLSLGSRNLLFGSPAFDLFIQETVSTLMAGGCLCVPSSDDHMGDISSVIQSMNVNLASFTSSFARQIRPEDVPSLKTLALVGEALAKDQQEIWADKLCLMNSYGPAECSVISTIKKGLTKSSDTTNIGRIILGSAWLVDPQDHDRLVPVGAAGELLIGGPLLGRGYLNDSEKTDASFIINPEWAIDIQSKSGRFYKTGDIVRYDVNDGSLVFEGRKDTQVKIRGQRVEIGEIEYQLSKIFPNVSGVAVELSKQDETPHLVAMIFCGSLWDSAGEPHALLQHIATPGISAVADVKSCLKKSLPQHMIPSQYYLVRNMPLLPSGKLDRTRLANELKEPSGSHLELREPDAMILHLDPGDQIALRLSEKLIKVSAGSNVDMMTRLSNLDLSLAALDLDSIQLISFLSFIRKEFGVDLSIAVLYDESLHISTLSKIISDGTSSTSFRDEKVDLPAQIEDCFESLMTISDLTQDLQVVSPTTTGGHIVFLTGATGYLGSEILHQLLDDVSVQKVIVHVRAESVDKALSRVQQAASLAKWWSSRYMSRIECWPGDLAKPQLGLSLRHWDILQGHCSPEERITAVIHNGAVVQWQAPYVALKATNVDSTVALLSAVRQWSFPASFVYVSGGVEVHRAEELDSLASRIETNANGYSQTKFVSEQLVSKVAENTSSIVDYSVVKPGLIIGTEDRGVPNTDDFLWRFVQACTTVGGYPVADEDSWLAVADVCEISVSIIASSFSTGHQTERCKTTVIESGVTVDDFWATVTAVLDSWKPLKPMKGGEWVSAIRNLLKDAPDDHPYRPLEAMLQESTYSLGSPNVARRRSHSNVRRAIQRNLRTLLDTGFFAINEISGKWDHEGVLKHSIPTFPATTFSRSSINKSKFSKNTNLSTDKNRLTPVVVQ